MKRSLLPLLGALIFSPAWAASTDCANFYADGAAPEITNRNIQRGARELCFSAYGVMHSGTTRTPLWSAEHLTRQSISQAKTMKRENSFHEENNLPANERSSLSDYARSGYDRGHMSPSGDMPNANAQYESFTLANMIPQNSDNNRNLWEGIESAVRTMTMQRGELYVITGPLFLGKSIEQLHSRVMVPTNIFKLVYDPRTKEASAYLVKNEAGSDYQIISVAQLESLAGITFLPDMDSQRKQVRVELPVPTPHNEGHKSASSHSGHPSSILSLLHSLTR